MRHASLHATSILAQGRQLKSKAPETVQLCQGKSRALYSAQPVQHRAAKQLLQLGLLKLRRASSNLRPVSPLLRCPQILCNCQLVIWFCSTLADVHPLHSAAEKGREQACRLV